MRHDLVTSRSVEVNANASKVWEALTNPAIIKEYLHGTETTTDWKVGSEIRFHGQWEGTNYCDKGWIVENVTNRLLTYRYWSGFSGLEDKVENYNLVIYNIAAISDSRSIFTWTQIGFATEAGYNHTSSGMEAFLNTIKQIIERL